MLDAVGKPSPGIQRGVLYFIGNYDQCAATVARIPVNASLGEYHNSDEVTFNTRYCRSTFKLPMGLVNAVAGEHANVSIIKTSALMMMMMMMMIVIIMRIIIKRR